ncbi:MAG: N-6 DNA methylase [DPANN group archaeon]|nr:N-6 DNA methylase [DPANN group archaeon]
MEYIIVFSKDNLCLAKEDLFSRLEVQNISYSVKQDLDNAIIIESIAENIDFTDLSHTREVGLCIGGMNGLDVVDFNMYQHLIKSPVNVRVTRINPEQNQDRSVIEKKMGAFLFNLGYKFNLKDPKTSFRVYLFGSEQIFGILIKEFGVSSFSERMPVKRPFFHPVSLKPKVAKAMCNIARVSSGKSVIDPFVGTGGLLIESALIGAKITGIDLDRVMVEGTIANLKHYGILEHNILCADSFIASKSFKDKFDCIVTDLPYGRNTKLDVTPKDFMQQFLLLIPNMLKIGCYAAVSTNVGDIEIPHFLKLVRKCESYIHKNLTKYIYLFKLV